MAKPRLLNIIIIISIWALSSCKNNEDFKILEPVDVVLVGAGIMSASVGSMLKELEPNIHIQVFERLEDIALESSDVWNNAGTGHAAYCELTYTSQKPDKTFDISQAIKINEHFELSKEYWSYLLETQKLKDPRSFINNVPHMSFVQGAENVSYLKSRFLSMKDHPFFRSMEYSEDPAKLKEWAPLLMQGRAAEQKVAATHMQAGTDVNFGALTRSLFGYLSKSGNTQISLSHEVYDFKKNDDQSWWVFAVDNKTHKKIKIKTKFLFIGAGGAAITLLQKTKIQEARQFAGFPVGGEWLVSDNQKLVEQHLAKVYGKASVGSPPMSVPHLDTRYIDGKRSILFGPFALFSTKFLKNGSWLDILSSFHMHNAWPMIQAGFHNIAITKYLISQVLLSKEGKMDALREYFPAANSDDWQLLRAGQRVQIIKNLEGKGGTLQFGTEVVSSQDGSVVALLGASPGASVSVHIALSVLKKAFSKQMNSESWLNKLKLMVPSYNIDLSLDEKLLDHVRQRNKRFLELVQ